MLSAVLKIDIESGLIIPQCLPVLREERNENEAEEGHSISKL